MLLNLFGTLRNTGVPCTLREFLDLLAGLEKQLAFANSEDFYYLSRATLVKDEKHYDKFDRAFDIYFKGLETLDDIIEALVPEDWLRKEFEKFLSEDELKKIKSLKNDLFPERLAITKAGNKNKTLIAIVEGKKNIPRMKKIKP